MPIGSNRSRKTTELAISMSFPWSEFHRHLTCIYYGNRFICMQNVTTDK